MQPRGVFAANLRKSTLQCLSQMCIGSPEHDVDQCSREIALFASYMEIVAGRVEWYAAIRIEGSEEVVSERSLWSNAKIHADWTDTDAYFQE